MNLMTEVARVVNERRICTEDDLAPMFPQYRRPQIRKALQNGARRGMVKVVKRGRYRGPGGVIHAVWGAPDVDKAVEYIPPPKPAKVRVSSVFQLGNPLPESDWPKGWIGQVHRPLGEWNSTEEIA